MNKSTLKSLTLFLAQALFYYALVVLSLLLLKFNYPLAPGPLFAIEIACYLLVGLYVTQALALFLLKGFRIFQSYDFIIKVVILGALVVTYSQPPLAASLVILEEALRGFREVMGRASVNRLFDRLRTQPAVLLSSSFAVLIALGAALLSLPVATEGGRIHFFDALFTATSAVCVTGLVVQDTGTYFTPFGQGVILGLMQLGGLGIMTMSTSLALIIGKRLSIKERLFMQNVMEENDYQEFARIFRNIFRMTFVTEGIGAAVLTARWYFEFKSFGKALYFGIFHSVSAFCNAGFALFSDSFEAYRTDPVINITLTLLIIAGGLGFAVVYGLYNYGKSPKPRHFNLHLKMTLSVTGILLIGGMLFIFLTEYSSALLDMPLSEKLWISWFQSVTLRTAGFHTIDISTFTSATLFMFMVFMFIGASPGSTGGGIKTTTLGVLFFTVRSMIMGRDTVEGFGRSIPWDIVRKSISMTFIGGGIVTAGVIAFSLVEPFSLMESLFEVTSASGTVGLSLGVTSKLSALGKLTLTLLMYMGRIGPLTVAFLISTQKPTRGYDLPMGKIVVG
ncbi:MAG: TrkH family potassium uptake protein [bacterium]|nr:TrkH family potassium uptake protein [bacterium]